LRTHSTASSGAICMRGLGTRSTHNSGAGDVDEADDEEEAGSKEQEREAWQDGLSATSILIVLGIVRGRS
jgi:hypothetical protein